MSRSKLTKVEALKLIPAVVDGEATTEEEEAFKDFIADNSDVHNKYESMKKLTSYVSENYHRSEAPKSLKKFVESVSDSSNEKKDVHQSNVHPIDSQRTNDTRRTGTTSKRKVIPYLISAAAAVFIIIAGWQLFTTNSTKNVTYKVEESAYRHFNKHHGQFVKPTFQTASLKGAEQQIASDLKMNMHVPELDDATFEGVFYSNFVPDLKAPMLEYHIESSDTYVYIFAFNTKTITDFKELVRDTNAVKQCQKPTDFHVKNVEGKAVVSWVWDDIWYTAISDHNGNTLASLVKPLQYTKK